MTVNDKLQRVKALLRNILADNDRYQQVLSLLEQQRITMIRRHSDELVTLNDALRAHCQALTDSATERRQLLQALGLSADKRGIDTVCGWLPAAQKTLAQESWKTLERLVKRCRDYNEKNGELLTRQYEFVQRFLGNNDDFLYSR
ncbi:flagellar protein FlgN [Atlantibacter subterraneus]|uniref:flagellar protein FlgN n=1 Tax=Atlantibacter subterraneus TaxID=255519 RepID=UPI00289EEDC0|nr:flagellar protein FlgN [Atlantibacter subterranea]